MTFPGFYSFVAGECEPHLAIESLNAHNNFLHNLCNEILYSDLNTIWLLIDFIRNSNVL